MRYICHASGAGPLGARPLQPPADIGLCKFHVSESHCSIAAPQSHDCNSVRIHAHEMDLKAGRPADDIMPGLTTSTIPNTPNTYILVLSPASLDLA